jgi:TolB-like protein
MSFFEELKRRNVIRVGIAYAVASWLLLQLTEVLIELLELSPVAGKYIFLFLVIGFVPALIFAWAFEMTPEGLKREKDVDRSESIAPQTGRKLDRTIIVVLLLALVWFAFDKFKPEKRSGSITQSEQVAGNLQPKVIEPDPFSEPSIAVLPFTDMSQDKDQEYFSDGIAEELLNLLVRVDGLKVASRTSSFSYKGDALSIADIAEELKVDHILEGSVRKAGNRVRITAQLIDTKTDRHLWSDTYDRELEDIFGIQDEIANAIVDALRAELGISGTGKAVSVTAATDNLDAYQLYLQARALFLARAQLDTAVSLFEQAVALDPDFARAWADLAANYSVMESWRFLDRDYNDLALSAAQKALDLDASLSTPWAVRAQVAGTHNDRLAAMGFLDRAIEMDPENTTHYLWRGIEYSTLGFQDESVADLERCLELDPAYENCRRHLSFTRFILNENEAAFRLFQEGAERGYSGANRAPIQRYMSFGKRELATQLLWTGEEIGSLLPGKEILDAMAFPNRDHSKGLAKFEAFVESTGNPIDRWAMIYAIFGAYHRVGVTPGLPRWIWLEENRGFRQSEYFKPHLEELGLPAYWRERGFPPDCRPLGDEDFECD